MLSIDFKAHNERSKEIFRIFLSLSGSAGKLNMGKNLMQSHF